MTTITTPNYVVLAPPLILAGCTAPVAQPFNGNIREAFEREAHMHRYSQEELNLKNKSRQYRKSIGIIVWALDAIMVSVNIHALQQGFPPRDK